MFAFDKCRLVVPQIKSYYVVMGHGETVFGNLGEQILVRQMTWFSAGACMADSYLSSNSFVGLMNANEYDTIGIVPRVNVGEVALGQITSQFPEVGKIGMLIQKRAGFAVSFWRRCKGSLLLFCLVL